MSDDTGDESGATRDKSGATAGEPVTATDESGATDDSPEASADALTHTDESGTAGMVNVGSKPDSDRRAVARGELRLQPSTVEAIRADELAKGDVLTVARIGATRAVKHTWEAIPLCHQIPITGVDVDFELADDRVVCRVEVETTGKTGCEMEAMQGVTGGLNTVLDMVKAAEKGPDGEYPTAEIAGVRVVSKRVE